MNFSYQAYVTRYKYDPYKWPPDLGLAQLHARCSQPGIINYMGIQCPCCKRWSKKIIQKWWKRSIQEDLQEYGAAIPGYFQLFKFYGFFIFAVLMISSLYTTYATFYTCNSLDSEGNYCLQIGFLYYLEFNQLIKLLKKNDEDYVYRVLMILHTVTFYLLLFGNFFSIFFITIYNESARQEIKNSKSSKDSRFLLFHSYFSDDVDQLLKLNKQNPDNQLLIVKAIKLKQIKNYYQYVKKRNQLYYSILSIYVVPDDPLKVKQLNQKLQHYHNLVMDEQTALTKNSGRVLVMFKTQQAKALVHKIYSLSTFKRWEYGFRTILQELNYKKFDQSQIQMCTVQVVQGSDLKWQNIGQGLGKKTASRFKTFLIAAILIGICYVVLYYPILFSMQTHVKTETQFFVRLTTFQKILPLLTSLFLIFLAIKFRSYMQKISEQRNPRDQLQKASFVLLTTLTFHIIFYVLLPTFFVLVPNSISATVKLYVVAEQAKTFIIVQLILVLVDMPYKMWHSKKVRNLSDQRYAFRYNQKMLHDSVSSPQYPLQSRILVLFRVWSLAMFYSFFEAYVLFYIIIAFLIIFWIEKRNLYNHFSVRRKMSITLFSQVLIYLINFFSLFLCIVYISNVYFNTLKIIFACLITLSSIAGNIVYWVILKKGSKESIKNRPSLNMSLDKSSDQKDNQNTLLVKQQRQNNMWDSAEDFQSQYKKFVEGLQNQKLDKQIEQYLKQYRKKSQNLAKSVEIQMVKQKSEEIHQNQYKYLYDSD